jgi:type II secretory pathway component PulM
MRWPPWRRHHQKAKQALEESQADLERVRERAQEVHKVAAMARKIRRDNHLGPAIARALEGR